MFVHRRKKKKEEEEDEKKKKEKKMPSETGRIRNPRRSSSPVAGVGGTNNCL